MKMRNVVIFITALLSIFSMTAAASVVLTGAGATFPYPLYVKWAQAYKTSSGNQLNYQPIGSGGGIKQIQAKTVDFGASDKPLTSEELRKANLVQFPAVVGGVVSIVNLPDIKNNELILSGDVLANIYLGNIKNWNDTKIAALNPSISLPNLPITVVHRSDGSGTTFLFTDYLSKASVDWQKKVGSNTAVAWPTGIGGKGNEGVASYVQRVKGGIGYVEYAYAKQGGLFYTKLQNKSGQAVSPSLESFQAAAANAEWNGKSDFAEILTDEAGQASWPITGATFILMQAKQTNPQTAEQVLKFFDWAYQNGQTMAKQLDYVPLPDNVIASIRNYWKEQILDQNGQPIWR